MRKNIFAFLLFPLIAFGYFYHAFLNNLLPAYQDIYGYFYPMMGIIKEQYLSGTIPLWNNYLFSGFPLMAASQPGVLYPISVIPSLFLPQHLAFLLDIAIHFSLAGFFTYLYARKIGIEFFGALTAGALFAFMGYLVVHLEFTSMLRTAVWIPLILFFLEELRATLNIRSAFKASLALALQIFAGHPQIYFFTYMIVVFFILYYSIQTDHAMRLRFLSLSAGAIVVGFIIASPQLYATYELSSLSVRTDPTYDNFMKHPFPVRKVPALLFPSLYNGNTEGYLGILPGLLAIAAFVLGWKSNVHIKFWGAVAVGSLSLALGDAIRPLNQLMFHLPIYNAFRGFSKHLIEFDLALALLAGFGISFILKSEKAKKTLIFTSFSLFFVFVISALVLAWTGISTLLTPKHILSLFLILVGILMLAFVLRSGRYPLFKYIVIFAVFLEIVSFRQIKWVKAESIRTYESQLFSRLEGKQDRVAFLGDKIVPLLAMSHKISLIEGYDPLILNDYDLLLDLGGIGGWTHTWPELVKNNLVFSMLNARYLVLPPGMRISDPTLKYKFLFETPSGAIYENMHSLPRVYPIAELIGMDRFDQIQTALYTLQINPKTQAIVSRNDLISIGMNSFAEGKVSILDYSFNKVLLKTDFSAKGFVVLADSHYPGWYAYIDGKPTDIYKTNGILRGVKVPSGSHEILFKYQPWKIYACMALSMLTLAGIVIILIRTHGYQRSSSQVP